MDGVYVVICNHCKLKHSLDKLIPGVGVGVGVGLVVLLHVGHTVTASVSRVTAPIEANARPVRVALVVRVILDDARIFPKKLLEVASVAEVPTTQ